MKKRLLLFAIVGLLITVNQSLFAQSEIIAGKQFYVEWGGPGVIMSANFDARFKSSERLGLGYRLGVGYGTEEFLDNIVKFFDADDPFSYFKDYTFPRPFYTVPVGLNYAFGKPNRSSSFEFGAGVTFLSRKVSLYYYEMKKPGLVIGSLSFMYRLMPANGGFSFRVGITPIIGTSGDLFPMGAVGFGYAF